MILNKKTYIAFLDIDGVLTENFEMKEGNFEYGRQVPFKLEAKENIHYLQYYTNCKFVITSTWRITLTKNELEIAFKERGLNIKIHDVTPILNCERGQEIDVWLQCNECDDYIIIDDHVKDIRDWCKNIIEVNPNEGFSESNLNLGMKYLEK